MDNKQNFIDDKHTAHARASLGLGHLQGTCAFCIRPAQRRIFRYNSLFRYNHWYKSKRTEVTRTEADISDIDLDLTK